MSISRTPDGLPGRCPLCQAEMGQERCGPATEVNCPDCGVGVARAALLIERLQAIAKNYESLELEEMTARSPWPPGGDSLTAVEVMLELEREMGVRMPADAVDRIYTVGDAIRFFEQQLRCQRLPVQTGGKAAR